MVENNVLAEKSIAFAIRIVKCYKYLVNEKNEYVMAKQILRSGTSIGANVHEAIYAQSKADFMSKMSISLKEASETSYWLVLLRKTDFIDEKIYSSLKGEVDEIIRIIVSTLKTVRKNELHIE